MPLRTISVEAARRTELDATLLCGFATPASGRNFIVYSLNERVDESDLRVYVISPFKTDDDFRLGRLDANETCKAAIQVLRQLVRGAITGNRRTSDLVCHPIDLQDTAIAPPCWKKHHPLVLKCKQVMKFATFRSPHSYGPILDGEEPCVGVPPLVRETLFGDAVPDVFATNGTGEALDGPAEPIDKPEAAKDEIVTEVDCVKPESWPEAETAAPEGGTPVEFTTKAEQLAKVVDTEAVGAFADSANHLREEFIDLAQLLHPALHATDTMGSANLPSPDTAGESSISSSPSPLAASAPASRPVSTRVLSLSLRLRVPPACLAGAKGEANVRKAPTRTVTIIRQLEDRVHVNTDTTLDIGNDTEHLPQDVQDTLADLAGTAQQPSLQKQEALRQQESLGSLQMQLHEKERQLQEKERQLRQWHKHLRDDCQTLEREAEQSNRLLAERSTVLQQLAESVETRERSSMWRVEILQIEQECLEELRGQQSLRQAELEKHEASVQQRSLELGGRSRKLENVHEKLAQIVKGLNETVQSDTALRAINHTGLKRQRESTAGLEQGSPPAEGRGVDTGPRLFSPA